MSDIRFILAGVALIFAGFLVLGILGGQYRGAVVQDTEFNECVKYFDDAPPQTIDCNQAIQESTAFFALVLAILGAGIFALVKGYRGKWDNEVPPDKMLGPGGDRHNDSKPG